MRYPAHFVVQDMTRARRGSLAMRLLRFVIILVGAILLIHYLFAEARKEMNIDVGETMAGVMCIIFVVVVAVFAIERIKGVRP